MSNVLDRYDQTYFSFGRAVGVTNLVQCVWVYNRDADIDGLRRFHQQLRQGLLARRIERSPLPFGRDRWVAAACDQPELEIVAVPRPRSAFDGWLDEQANTPLDAQRGPGWHLAVLPFADGGTGVSLVVSHCLIDGVGLVEAVSAATSGAQVPISWPAGGSRARWRALAEDTRQALRDIPAVGAAVADAARFVRRRGDTAGAQASVFPGADEAVTLSTAVCHIDAEDWDARAAALGGTGNTLLTAVAARLAQRVGRVTADGFATPSIPVSTRTAGDTRANAITNVDITVDPASAATDLRAIRAATKAALTRAAEAPDERWALLPLVPLLPQRIIRRVVAVATGGTTNVVASNLGTTPPALNRPDGTDADYFAMKSLYPDVSEAVMHRIGGVLALVSGRVHDRVFISALGYQPGRPNSNEQLRRDISSVLDDFSLTASAGWPQPASERT